MRVELLVVPECPTEAGAVQLLRTALSDIGLPDVRLTTTTIATQAEAERKRFVGSPTFLVDGTDLFEEPGRPRGIVMPGLSACRGPARTARVGRVAASASAGCGPRRYAEPITARVKPRLNRSTLPRPGRLASADQRFATGTQTCCGRVAAGGTWFRLRRWPAGE
jgi:hypothetical protein